VVEFGIGREAYTLTEKVVIFNFITIVSRLWQFLVFTFDLYHQFYPDIQDGVLLFLNIRGTDRALIGDLAEGWQQPGYHLINPYNPRCLDKHLQIRKQISSPLPTGGIEEVIQYFATRIDNAWGEFEPRCYVHEKRDASKPFAYRMPR
jgi:hypothetical protein